MSELHHRIELNENWHWVHFHMDIQKSLTKFSIILKRLCTEGFSLHVPQIIYQSQLRCVLYFLREARLSPYAVSTHTDSNAKMRRPKSAILSQKGRAKRSTDPPNWESMPQTVIGWADKTDWVMAEQRPKQRMRPVSAPATRNRWVGQIMQFVSSEC